MYKTNLNNKLYQLINNKGINILGWDRSAELNDILDGKEQKNRKKNKEQKERKKNFVKELRKKLVRSLRFQKKRRRCL